VIPEAVAVVHELGQVMELDSGQALDGRPVVLEAVAVVHEPGR